MGNELHPDQSSDTSPEMQRSLGEIPPVGFLRRGAGVLVGIVLGALLSIVVSVFLLLALMESRGISWDRSPDPNSALAIFFVPALSIPGGILGGVTGALVKRRRLLLALALSALPGALWFVSLEFTPPSSSFIVVSAMIVVSSPMASTCCCYYFLTFIRLR